MPSDTSEHATIGELLPWYVNGTLRAEERRQVEAHLETCAACRGEVAMLQAVARALQADAPVPAGDLFARTSARLQPRGLAALARPLRRLLAPVPPYARVAVAVQFLVIVALAAALAYQAGPLVTLTGPPDGGPAGPAVRMQVIFQASAMVGEIQEALTSMRARIVDGPSAGVYVVDIPLGSGAVVATADEALRRLRNVPVVSFAEIVEERR